MKKLLSFLIMLITVIPHAQADLSNRMSNAHLEQIKRDITNGERVSVNHLYWTSEAAARGDNTAFILLQFLMENGGKVVINENFYGRGTILKLIKPLGKYFPDALKVISYLRSQGAHE